MNIRKAQNNNNNNNKKELNCLLLNGTCSRIEWIDSTSANRKEKQSMIIKKLIK